MNTTAEQQIKDRYREAVEATQVHEMRTMLSNVIYCTIRDMVYQLNGFDLPEDFDKHADRKAERALDQMLRTCPPEAWSKLAAPVMSKEAALREREHLLKTLANIEATKIPKYIQEMFAEATPEEK